MPIIVTLPAVGLASSPAFRAIIVARHLEPARVRPARYAAVLPNAALFACRYRVSLRRVRAVVDTAIPTASSGAAIGAALGPSV